MSVPSAASAARTASGEKDEEKGSNRERNVRGSLTRLRPEGQALRVELPRGPPSWRANRSRTGLT